MRAVLRRVDALLVVQAQRNAAVSLAQSDAVRLEEDRTLAELHALDLAALEPRESLAVAASGPAPAPAQPDASPSTVHPTPPRRRTR